MTPQIDATLTFLAIASNPRPMTSDMALEMAAALIASDGPRTSTETSTWPG